MNESNIAGMSIRGIIAFIVLSSLCGVCVWLHTTESLAILKDVSLVILTFYYVQKTSQNGGTNVKDSSVSDTNKPV